MVQPFVVSTKSVISFFQSFKIHVFLRKKISKTYIEYTLGGEKGYINRAFHDGGRPPFSKKLMLPVTPATLPERPPHHGTLPRLSEFLKRNLKNFHLYYAFCIFSLELYL